MAAKTSVDASKFDELRKKIIADENGATWNLAKTYEGCVTYRKSDDENMFKFVINMTGIPVDDCVKLMTDYELRKRYDKSFAEMKMLEETADYHVTYWYYSLPFPCSDRDLVNFTKVYPADDSKTTMVIIFGAPHPDAPEKPKVVRAETILTGQIMRPDEKDANSTVLTILSRVDMKGMIPTFVINSAVIGSGDQLRKNIMKFYTEEYSKEKK